MRKLALPLTLLCFCSGLLFSQSQTRIKLLPDEEKYAMIGLVGGFFFLQDATFQELYAKSAPFSGAELALRFPFQDPHGLYIGLSGQLLRMTGQTSYTEEELKLRLINLSLSLCYSYDSGTFGFFVGPGVEHAIYKEQYAETFPIESQSGSETGLHFTGGVGYHLTSALSLKAYFKYVNVATEAPGFRVNLGGTQWGLGISYRFYL
ncbi:MAG: outer membrane beta-barrel protein [Acidobacteriota bacterium]